MTLAIRPFAVSVLLVLAGICSAAGRATAADEPRPRQRAVAAAQNPAARLAELRERLLKLVTDDQKPKVLELLEKARKQIDAIRDEIEKNPDLRATARERAQQVFQTLREELAAILTPEQQQKAWELAGQGMQRANQLLQRLGDGIRQLDLTEDQKQQLFTLREQLREKIQDLRQAAGGDRQAAARKLREIGQDLRSQLQQILSPEQQEKLRKLMEEPAEPPAK